MKKTEKRLMELAQVITDEVNAQSKTKEAFKTTILAVGHMNGSIFNPTKIFNSLILMKRHTLYTASTRGKARKYPFRQQNIICLFFL